MISEDTVKEEAVRLVAERKPETVKQLVQMLKDRFPVDEKQLLDIILVLQDEGKIALSKLPSSELSLRSFLVKEARWYWATVMFSALTTATVFLVPLDAQPWINIRYAFSVVFVLWMPGYCVMNLFFPTQHASKPSETLTSVERFALNFGLSIALTAIVGLVLNYTPWGLTLAPITLGLLALTLGSATAAVARERALSRTNAKKT